MCDSTEKVSVKIYRARIYLKIPLMNHKIRIGAHIESVLNLEGTAEERGIQFAVINRNLVEVVGPSNALLKIAKECDETAKGQRELESKNRAHLIRAARNTAKKIRDLIEG